MSRDSRLGHVHLKVRDLDRAVEFYTAILDVDLTERYERFAFLTFGDRHHDLAVQAVGEDAPGPGPGVGLYHVAFEALTPRRYGRPTNGSASATST